MRNKTQVYLPIFSATLHGKKEELCPVCGVAKAAHSPRNIFFWRRGKGETTIKGTAEPPLTTTFLQGPRFFKPLYKGHFLLSPRWPVCREVQDTARSKRVITRLYLSLLENTSRTSATKLSTSGYSKHLSFSRIVPRSMGVVTNCK